MEYQPIPLIVYKNKQQINSINQLPVPHTNRICTDVFCTVFSIIAILAMLVIAIITFDLDKLSKSTYPTDIEGRLCTLDNQMYNYLYFTSPNDPTKRLCVQQCPQGYQPSLKCLPSAELSCHSNSNPKFQVLIYPSQPSDTSMGLYCFPKDEELKQKILKNSKLNQKYLFVTAYRSILYSAGSAVILGILFLALTLFLPTIMTYFTILVGGLSCIAIAIFLMVVNSEILYVYQAIRITICIFMILVGLMCVVSFFFKVQDLRHCSAFLAHAGKYLSQQLIIVLLVPVYYILMAVLFCLIIFQILAYWSYGQLKLNPEEVTKQLGGTFSTIMVIVCGIQFFWMISFLKESFDFLISGNTVYYYFKKKHAFSFALGNLFKFHWGSVIAGSFLLNFFYVFDTFYDFIKPQTSNSKLTSICCLCDRILGFSRSDVFSFINILGQPFCNSARYCEEINDKSIFFEGSQSIFRFFRISAHIMLASLSTILTYIFMSISSNEISVLGLLLSFLINLFVVTFFISILAEIAQSILLSTLVDKYLKNEDQITKITNKNDTNKYEAVGYTVHQTQQ